MFISSDNASSLSPATGESPNWIDLFDQGNYLDLAQHGPEDEWRTHAARGLIGLYQRALTALGDFTVSEEARFYRAVIAWLSGDDHYALSELSSIRSPRAQKLSSLIAKPKITVLAQLPGHWQCSDPKFEIYRFGYGKEDQQNQPYSNIHNYYSKTKYPDFFVSMRYEHMDIPPNVYELNCPLLGVVADYSVHIHSSYESAKLFDETIVAGGVEWRDMLGITSKRVSTFPKLYPIPKGLRTLSAAPRSIDFFLSGNIVSPYYPEKARLLHLLLEEQINLKCVAGYVDQYLGYLEDTKISLSYVQHSDGMPTRALESLAQGSAVMVQRDCPLLLWCGEEEGLVAYQSESDFVSGVRKILNNWELFEQRAKRGAMIVRDEFLEGKIVSENLRFLTFLASNAYAPREPRDSQDLMQKECMFFRGSNPQRKIRDRRLEINLGRFETLADSLKDENTYLDTARELVLDYGVAVYAPATLCHIDSQYANHKIRKALDIYREGMDRFPKSLMLLFNFCRAAFHFGAPRDVSDAIQRGSSAFKSAANEWRVALEHDCFPYDFFPMYFNYRRYLDLVTSSYAKDESVEKSLIEIVLASLSSYLGVYTHGLEFADQSVRLDPEFPYYQLRLATELIGVGGINNYQRAGQLLESLIGRSYLFMEAYDQWRLLVAEGNYISANAERIKAKMERAKEQVVFAEQETLRGAALRLPSPRFYSFKL